MLPTTIAEVLVRLTTIIEDSIKSNSRTGYFAALYYKVTFSVQQGILYKQFQDGPRMEELDVVFANRYLAAYEQWQQKQSMSGPWQVAFAAVERASPLVLQQLLLGMNAHINLDLGIAAATVMKGKHFEDLSSDFNQINSVIASLTNQVIRELDRVSPLLSLLGFHASNFNSILIQFSIDSARDGAWRFAEELSTLTGSAYDQSIASRERDMEKLASNLLETTPLIRFTLWVIHVAEWKKPARIVKVMHESKKPYLKMEQMQ